MINRQLNNTRHSDVDRAENCLTECLQLKMLPAQTAVIRNHLKNKQGGAALVLALIMLAVLTIFAITSINVSNTEDAMMHNTLDYKVALASAEAALKDGIDNVVDNPQAPKEACASLSATATACGGTGFYDLDSNSDSIRISTENTSYWNARAADIQSVSNAQLEKLSGSDQNIPQRIVTKHRIPGSSLDIGFNSGVTKYMYEITAIGRDKNNKAQVVLRQSLVRNEAN